ncbi:DNA-processing protein DprA [Gloeocapsa sp. PCC 73106]|uniref:DNA-processing protein DprA n=1 Tax=Gloeocapsa sp. PCC 73106 TaxID=102232 RepID=UPI0005533116|nr:DNA-processing protein DprA [Gloeocapsa sp. PCC 73106]
MSSERAYWLAWSQVPGMGPILLQKIAEGLGSLKEAWEIDLEELKRIEGIKTSLMKAIAQTRNQLDPEAFLIQHSLQNPHFWTPADPDYPNLLLEIQGMPPVIYYRGEVRPEENQGIIPLIAIVGTRRATEHGYRWANKLSSYLAKYGITIVGGMAPGIENCAQEACLASGGRTIAVLGTGVDVIYPLEMRQLYEKIRSQGLIISEYPAGSKPERPHFPARNRLIAALCRGVLVVEAPEKSGALITARYANELGRDVYVVPNSPDVVESRGCLRLINEGANLILDEQDLLTQLGSIPHLDQPLESLPDLTPELAQVLAIVQTEPTSFEAIALSSNLASGIVAASLLELELLGLISQLPGMRYIRS